MQHSPKCRPDPVLLPESFCIPLRRRLTAVSPEPIIRLYFLHIEYSTVYLKRQVGFQIFSAPPLGGHSTKFRFVELFPMLHRALGSPSGRAVPEGLRGKTELSSSVGILRETYKQSKLFPTNTLGVAFVVTKFVRVTMVQFTLSASSRHLSQWERQGSCAKFKPLDISKFERMMIPTRHKVTTRAEPCREGTRGGRF